MNLSTKPAEYLFSYGTLQTEPVQLAIFGRTVKGTPDALTGYRLTTAHVQDQNFVTQHGAEQRNLQHTGLDSDTVEGSVLTLTKAELEQTDAYEPNDYERVLVQLRSGAKAWVYISLHS